jgi:hypothetical protein
VSKNVKSPSGAKIFSPKYGSEGFNQKNLLENIVPKNCFKKNPLKSLEKFVFGV